MNKSILTPLFFSVLILVFLYLSLSLLTYSPPVWPDETYITDIAINFLNKGVIATNIWGPLIPGASEHVLWYPPALFIILAGWIKLFGVSIVSERILSILFAVFFLLSYYLLNNHLTKSKFLSFLILVLLITDDVFLEVSKLIRPEIFVLFFANVSLYLSLLINEKYSSRLKNILALAIGLTSALAILIHFMAVVFVIPIILQILFVKKIRMFSISFFLPILAWVISIIPNFSLLKEQLFLQYQTHFSYTSTLGNIFCCRGVEFKISYSIYFALAIIFLIYSLKVRKKTYLLLSLIQILSLFYIFIGKIEWYMVLLVPFIYSNLGILIKKTHHKILYAGLIFLLLITIMINLKIYLNNYFDYKNDNFSYNQFKEDILKIIPEKKVVYLSSIPDAYFVFSQDRENQLFQFPALHTTKDNLGFVLNKSDYLIYNMLLGDPYLMGYFLRYTILNQFRTFIVGQGGYQVQIIELKPHNLRILPNDTKYD